MSARDDILVGLRAASASAIGDETPEELLELHRAEVLREAAPVVGAKCEQHGVFGVDTMLLRLADEHGKDSQKAESTQAAEFFQPGRTYRSQRCADLRFECMARSADPDSGEQQAIGWRFGPPHNGIRPHRIAALGADDWACCGWTDITEAGGAADA
jgi:hypothetical protein